MRWLREHEKSLRFLREVRLMGTVNGFVYALRKIPLLGARLGDRYAFSALKRWMRRLESPLSLLRGLFQTMVSLLFVHWLLVANVQSIAHQTSGESSWLLALHPVSASITLVLYMMYQPISFPLLERLSETAQMIRWMHVDLRILCEAFLLLTPLHLLVGRWLAFALFLPGLSWIGALAWSTVLAEISLCSHALNLHQLSKGKEPPVNRVRFALCVWLFGLGASVFVGIQGVVLLDAGSMLALLLAIPALGAIRRILREPNYSQVQYLLFEKERSFLQLKKDLQEGKTDIKRSEKREARLRSRIENRQGYALLNALFFERFNRQIVRPVRIRTGVLLVLGVAGILALRFLSQESEEGARELLRVLTTWLPFFLYWLCHDSQTIPLMFRQCDAGLLAYGFYKQPKALLTMFFHRCRSMLCLKLLPILVLSALFLLGALLLPGWTMGAAALRIALTFLLGAVISVYDLFLYYLLQPYTIDGKMRHPFLSIGSWSTYIVCYVIGIRNVNIEQMIPALLAVLATLLGISFAAVWKISPKTFRLYR